MLYTGHVRAIVPDVTKDNLAIVPAANKPIAIMDISYGGEATVSTAMVTRFARTASDGTVPVTGDVQKKYPNAPAAGANFVKTWTAQPTLNAGNLIPITDWNSDGGVVRWYAGPGDEIYGINEQISCRNAVGTATSSYGLSWKEF